jgi:BlaI family transcriptional regulator, penicillinase repressor
MTRPHQLGDLQLAIMRVLWERGEATVQDVHQLIDLPWRRAPTTIATMLTKLEKKGVVSHRVAGRQFVYRATVSEEEVRRSMVSELTKRLFEGDVSALVSHLIDEQRIDRQELAALRELLERRDPEGEGTQKPEAEL